MELLIRRATAADEGVLVAFNTAIAWETEHKRLDPAVLGAGVRAVLADPAWPLRAAKAPGGPEKVPVNYQPAKSPREAVERALPLLQTTAPAVWKTPSMRPN